MRAHPGRRRRSWRFRISTPFGASFRVLAEGSFLCLTPTKSKQRGTELERVDWIPRRRRLIEEVCKGDVRPARDSDTVSPSHYHSPASDDGWLCPAVLVLLAAIFTLCSYRRRRVRQGHLAHLQQTRRGSASAYGPYGSPGSQTLFTAQYPPPAHNSLSSPYVYKPTTGFAPVREIFNASSSLPTSLADAPLDVLTLAAFYRAGAVPSATTWRVPDQISEVKRRRGM